MSKRKREELVKLHYRPDGRVVSVIQKFKTFKDLYPSISLPPVFVHGQKAVNIFSELVHPTVFTPSGKGVQPDYYIAPGQIDDGTYIWNNKTFTVKGNELWHLGSEVCDHCFLKGQLEPKHGCREHNIRICGHKRVPTGSPCASCIPWSLAGFWNEKLQCFAQGGNKLQPHEIARASHKKFKFKCNQCPHTFESALNHVTIANSWCPYCSGRELCGVEDCTQCFDRSLASWPFPKKLQCFVQGGNNLQPHEVFLASHNKFKFKCNQCPHIFESRLGSITKEKPHWCPYCARKTLCGVEDCTQCFDRSIASWPFPKKLQCFVQGGNNLQPHEVFLASHNKFKFKCNQCPHIFESALHSVTNVKNPVWCPYCARKTLCGVEDCTQCFDRSLASWPFPKKLQCFVQGGNNLQPHEVFLASHNKFKFKCNQCPHIFESALHSVTNVKNPVWCPYCARKTLCGVEDCTQCFDRSLASWPFPKKLQCFVQGGNNLQPHEVFLASHNKFKFKCNQCPHIFESALHSVTNVKNPVWCPYCARKTLCGVEDCTQCFDRSLASWPFPKKLQCFVQGGNNLQPHEVFLASHNKFKFKCNQCPHIFESRLGSITKEKPHWCPYCAGRVCGKESCKICAKQCEDGLCTKKAQCQTRQTHIWFCDEHMNDAIKRDPNETPLQLRAKVSLEIYTLADMQRHARDTLDNVSWIFGEAPTTWDCAILPGLSFKPDNLWLFDKFGNFFSTAGSCKINTGDVAYALQLEVTEYGLKQHSDARTPSDAVRERQIRECFKGIPMGFVYIVVAHNGFAHVGAHSDDVFFQKPAGTQEYELIENRAIAWNERMEKLLVTLRNMLNEHTNDTVYIGH